MTPSKDAPGSGPADRHGGIRSDQGPVPRDRAGETRERIVDAGVELLHAGSVRDWKRLTIRAAAAHAGVNERTVYRHFGDEKGLRDAVLHRNAQEAGIKLDGMQLEDIAKVATQIFNHISEYPVEPRPQLSPTLIEATQRQNDAVLSAIVARTEGWPRERQMLAAAMVDVLWSVATYERLTVNWQADLNQAVEGVSWVIGLIERDVKEGQGPG
jgi:AcrR family transcriptional regulator